MSLKEGSFEAIVTDGTWTTSANGTAGLILFVQIPALGEEMQGTIWFSDRAMLIARRQLKAIGFNVDTVNLDSIDTHMEFAGRHCMVTLKEETWKEKTRIKIAFFGNLPTAPDKAMLAAVQEKIRALKHEDTDDLAF